MSRTKKGSKRVGELTLPSRRCPPKQKYELPSTAKPAANRAGRRKANFDLLKAMRQSDRELERAARASKLDQERGQA